MCELLELSTSQPSQLTCSLHTLASHGSAASVAHDGWGVVNFLYTDGDAVFAHGHRRLTGVGGPVEPPGLWALRRHRAPADPAPARRAGVSLDHGDGAAVFIASVPLTDEAWRLLQDGELMAVRDGEVVATRFAVPV